MISKQNLTIVCASHNGENKLPLFLDSIKKNSQKPKEIIICGTNASDINKVSKDTLQSLDIKFVVSDIANQIYQRRLAISMIKTSYILQLDDDLILEENAIKKYCSHFNTLNSANNIVSGYTIFPNGKHMSSRFKSFYKGSKLIRIFLYILNGFNKPKNMSILKSGRIIPLINEEGEIHEPEWLSSCLMFHKDALDKESKSDEVYNNNGKAYYEDVFFTLGLKKKGYNLILDNDIKLTHPYTSSIKPIEFLKTISSQKKILRISGGSFFLFCLDVIFSFIFYLLLHLKSNTN